VTQSNKRQKRKKSWHSTKEESPLLLNSRSSPCLGQGRDHNGVTLFFFLLLLNRKWIIGSTWAEQELFKDYFPLSSSLTRTEKFLTLPSRFAESTDENRRITNFVVVAI
jgi:hypothetical protein